MDTSYIAREKEAAATFTEKEINDITNPATLSPLQEEFLYLHERL